MRRVPVSRGKRSFLEGKKMKSTKVVSALAVLTAAGAQAMAGFSGVGSPPASEFTHLQILDAIYSSTFAASGLNFDDGSIFVTRVDDNGFGGEMNVLNGGVGINDDETWTDGIVFSEARARFAGFSQNFGYRTGASGAGVDNHLIHVIGSGIDPLTAEGTVTTMFNSPFRWLRTNGASVVGGTNVQSSLMDDNVGDRDQMVAYEVTGIDARKRWLLFFEDINGAVGDPGVDYDYNDMVIELVVVPLPTSALAGLAGLGLVGTGMIARRRRLGR
jgi:hypothetical protein